VAIGTPLVATKTNGTASPAAITAPAGRGVGDLLLVGYTQDSTSRSVTTPSGWTLVEGPVTSTTQRGYVYARVADGTATDNFSATISGATNWLCNMMAYPGVDTSGAILTTAIVAHGNNLDASAVTAMTTVSLSTPALSGCVLVGIFTIDAVSTLRSFSPTSSSPNVGTPVERYDNNEGTGFLAACGDDTVGLTLAASTSYTMTATCNGSEVGTHYAFILAPAASGTNYTASPSESEGLTDSAAPVTDAVRAPAEPLGLTDSATAAVDYVVGLSESVGLTDSATASGAGSFSAAPADNEPLTDATAALQVAARTTADSIGATDSVAASLDRVAVIADGVGATDPTTPLVATVRTVADQVGIIDAASGGGTGTASVTDGAGISDAATATADVARTQGDTIGVSDAVTVALDQVVTVADLLALIDSPVASATLTRSIADQLAATDAVGTLGQPPDLWPHHLGSHQEAASLGTHTDPAALGVHVESAVLGTHQETT